MSRTVSKDEQVNEERRQMFITFCKRYGLVSKRKYGGEMRIFPATEKIMETFAIKSRTVNGYWNGTKSIPDYILILMQMHEGEIERYCDIFNDD
ncbi:hypothetical protein P3547_19790 [Vibrio parahaemolyticus]|nr:hypothetical protein [Vibrio parahaemolyticus]